jgi:hypothetical protein
MLLQVKYVQCSDPRMMNGGTYKAYLLILGKFAGSSTVTLAFLKRHSICHGPLFSSAASPHLPPLGH